MTNGGRVTLEPAHRKGASMDAISTALTNAWLEAVRRVQSGRPPTQQVARDERTMIDAMEAALRHGGVDPWVALGAAPPPPGQVLDRRV
jgi:hypothetical protein